MKKNLILASGLLAGTIIGAGIFSLPYIFKQLGIVPGLFYLLVFAASYIFIYIMYSQLLMEIKDNNDFLFLIKKYFTPFFSKIISFSSFCGLLFALLAYLVLSPSFFDFGFNLTGSITLFIFWALSSSFFFLKLKWLGFAEFAGAFSIFAIVVALFVYGFFFNGSFDFELFPLFPPGEGMDWKLFVLPFGPVLFSFAGRSAVTNVVRKWREKKNFSIKKSVGFGVSAPLIIYLLFIFAILSISPQISEDTMSLLHFLPVSLKILLGFLGLLTLVTSYGMLGGNIKDILIFDLKTGKYIGFVVPLLFPPLLFLLGIKSFISILGIAGGIFVALETISIIVMWRKAFPEHKLRPLTIPLFAIFSTGLFYEIISIIF